MSLDDFRNASVHNITFFDAQKWCNCLIKRLGCMVLDYEEGGDPQAILCYHKALHRCIKCLIHLLQQTQSVDKRRDIQILINRLSILRKHVHQDFHDILGPMQVSYSRFASNPLPMSPPPPPPLPPSFPEFDVLHSLEPQFDYNW